MKNEQPQFIRFEFPIWNGQKILVLIPEVVSEDELNKLNKWLETIIKMLIQSK